MHCSNCGNEINEGTVFCDKCGQKIEAVSVAEQISVEAIEPEKPPRKKWWLLLIVLALIAGVVGIFLFVVSQKKMEIDLDGIVTFEVNGYSGYAKASISIDQGALEAKYKDDIYEHTELKTASFIKRVDLLEYEVTGLDGLSNGDKIVLSWKSDVEKALEEYKVVVNCKDVEYIIEGLPEVKMINPFDMLNISYNGISGEADAVVTMNSKAPAYMDNFSYWIEGDNGSYSNGDTVTVSFDNYAEDSVAAEYGVKFSQFSKSYQVSGLPEYISSVEQITLEKLKPFMLDSERYFKDYIERDWSDAASIKNLKCRGYFVSTTDGYDADIRNAVGLIYEVTANLYYEGISEDFVYYYPVVFPNVFIDKSGSISYNSNDIYATEYRFDRGFETSEGASSKTWGYYGFRTKEELLDAYYSYSLGRDGLTTRDIEEADFSEQAYGYKAEEREKKKEKMMKADVSELVADATDIFLNTTSGWSSAVNINSIQCAEMVYYTGEILSDAFNDADIYEVILEVNVSMEYKDMKEDFSYYYPVKILNGSQNYEECLRTFDRMLGDSEIWEAWQVGPSNVWRFHGYETLDEVHAEISGVRYNHVYYTGEILPVTLDTEETTSILTEEWLNADAGEIINMAEEAFLSSTESWAETASVNSIQVEETFIGVPNIVAGDDVSTLFGVLLKISAHVECDDMKEDFAYYYCVMFNDAMVNSDGTVWVNEDTMKVSQMEFKKMLGDKEIWKAWQVGPSNVWIFTGYPTLEIAHNDIAAISYNHLKYMTETISTEKAEE